MKTISIFNNKGGVGKTTLTYHLGHALAAMGHKTLVIDFDPQCNLTILSMEEELLHEIWSKEDEFVDDFERARKKMPPTDFEQLLSSVRSIHFLLKLLDFFISRVLIGVYFNHNRFGFFQFIYVGNECLPIMTSGNFSALFPDHYKLPI